MPGKMPWSDHVRTIPAANIDRQPCYAIFEFPCWPHCLLRTTFPAPGCCGTQASIKLRSHLGSPKPSAGPERRSHRHCWSQSMRSAGRLRSHKGAWVGSGINNCKNGTNFKTVFKVCESHVAKKQRLQTQKRRHQISGLQNHVQCQHVGWAPDHLRDRHLCFLVGFPFFFLCFLPSGILGWRLLKCLKFLGLLGLVVLWGGMPKGLGVLGWFPGLCPQAGHEKNHSYGQEVQGQKTKAPRTSICKHELARFQPRRPFCPSGGAGEGSAGEGSADGGCCDCQSVNNWITVEIGDGQVLCIIDGEGLQASSSVCGQGLKLCKWRAIPPVDLWIDVVGSIVWVVLIGNCQVLGAIDGEGLPSQRSMCGQGLKLCKHWAIPPVDLRINAAGITIVGISHHQIMAAIECESLPSNSSICGQGLKLHKGWAIPPVDLRVHVVGLTVVLIGNCQVLGASDGEGLQSISSICGQGLKL